MKRKMINKNGKWKFSWKITKDELVAYLALFIVSVYLFLCFFL